MDPRFRPYKVNMVTVKERWPCGRGKGSERSSKGRNFVYYLCQCDCGKEFVLSGDEVIRNPYSCGCTPRPNQKTSTGGKPVFQKKTPEKRKPRRTCSSGVTGVNYERIRDRWRATIMVDYKKIYLGYFQTKEEAIEARRKAERKYYRNESHKKKGK